MYSLFFPSCLCLCGRAASSAVFFRRCLWAFHRVCLVSLPLRSFFLAGRVLFGWTCVVIASFVVVVLVLLASWLSALSALSVVVGLCGERQVWGAESFGSVRQLSLV